MRIYCYCYLLRKDEPLLNQLSSILGNALLLNVLIFKFSFLLYRPSILLDNLKGILFFAGGAKGANLALLTSILYITFQLDKHHLFTRNVLFALLYECVTAAGVLSALVFLDQ
jgi:hypothetical protein